MSSSDDTGHDSVAMRRMKEKLRPFRPVEIWMKGINFRPRGDDVLIVTPGKCGTTWMQQVVHQLRSGGDMSYRNISDVVPFIEMAHEIDLDAEHEYQPRCFKTHFWYAHCPKGAGKYILLYREPCAAFFSYFNFFKDWFFQPGEITLSEFVTRYLLKQDVPKTRMERASYFAHLVSWWERRHDNDVLFLFFEDMKDDLEGVVRDVASFIGIQDEEKIKKAVEMSSFEYMKRHGVQFSCREMPYNKEAFGLPADCQVDMLVKGSATLGKEMMDDKTKAAIQAKWREVVGEQIGVKDYNELRSAFKNEKANRAQRS